MPSTVESLFAAASLQPAGPVRWGTVLPEQRPGVYAIALTKRGNAVAGTLPAYPADTRTLTELLMVRPDLKLDKVKGPTVAQVQLRLAGFWLADETVVYIGRSSRPLATRVAEYYGHRLGASSPHKGGWPLKTLAVLDKLWVHWAATDDFVEAEKTMQRAFAAAVSRRSAAALYRSDPLMPFANLEDGDRRRKQHGIGKATGSMPPRR